ncbi:MAG: transposase, partial [Longimicrobiales bacterium]
GVCPSCNARRMVEVAAHLVDHVLPPLPVRQWVLSLPKRLRPFLYRDGGLPGAVLAVLLRAIRSTLCRTSPDAVPDARLGAVSFPHRFGSALNPHFHFHVVVFDGLFGQAEDGTLLFHEATRLNAEDIERTERAVQRRVLRLFVRRGLIEDYVATDMLTWQAAGGFSVNAAVRVEGQDRAGRERLLRYCARPPFALERLSVERVAIPAHENAGAAASADVRRVLYRLPRAAPGGRTVLALSPVEFLDALAHLIPPPRVHRHRYHGVLAPNARLRPLLTDWAEQAAAPPVVPASRAAPSRDSGTEKAENTGAPTHRLTPRPTSRSATQPTAPPSQTPNPSRVPRSIWARLLARIYELMQLVCVSCGGELRIIAFLTDPRPVRAILDHLGLPVRPPPLAPARAPPELAFDFGTDTDPLDPLDQTPDVDPSEPEPIPEFVFDQRPGA